MDAWFEGTDDFSDHGSDEWNRMFGTDGIPYTYIYNMCCSTWKLEKLKLMILEENLIAAKVETQISGSDKFREPQVQEELIFVGLRDQAQLHPIT